MCTTGLRLKELREKRGWSQADVAKKIGVGRTTYLKYENGKNKPVRKLNELATLFEVSIDYILSNEKNKPPIFNDGEMTLIYDYRNLDDEGQTLLNKILEALRKSNPRKNPPNNQNVTQHNSGGGNNYLSVNGNQYVMSQ